MPYSLVLFDYDGTLCDTRRAISYSLRRALAELGQPAPAEAALQAVVQRGLPLAETLQQLRPPGARPAPAEWVETYRAIYRTEAEELVTPFPGAADTLAATRAAGAEIVVISNKGLAILENSLRRLGLYDYAALVVADDRAATGRPRPLKPDPALYADFIRPRFPHIGPAHTLMVGDTATDLQFARNCGLAAAWVTFGFGTAAECLPLQPAYQLHQLSELPPLLTGPTAAPAFA